MEKIAEKYNIIRLLGSGATGDVYLVEHEDLKLQYALKLLSKEVSNNSQIVERFIEEARVLEKFSHKNTAKLRDFGKTKDGRYYMTTDFCRGITLSKCVKKCGPLDYHLALRILIDILDVLSCAHSDGIVHRDIKSDNIIVNFNNTLDDYTELKVLDFGIAKMKQDLKLNDTKTIDGSALGTPQYMAPEQAAGEVELDSRIDIYSAGIVLYELLAGKVPFFGETVVQTLLMHLTNPVPPFDSSLNIKEDVANIVNKALQKIPNNRYQTADSFMQDCKEVLGKENKNSTYKNSNNNKQEKTKILCIDDNQMILNILSHILTKEGFEVLTTQDPSTIHSYLFQENIDLLISDVNMPNINGNDLCKMLKQTMPSLKIALFSNISKQNLETLAKDANADTWFSKCDKPVVWIENIYKALQG
ncbi:MAG: protein kinase domain-containing protein [Bdellovibrionota bacterium]